MPIESDDERRRRRRHRVLFDTVADLYDTSRRGYPAELVEVMVATAGLAAGSSVLEIGCGTGQLTGQLATRDLAVTAIDIGPAMIERARRRVDAPAVRFEVAAFEEFEAAAGSFDLVVSATAFHWIDPEVRFVKVARLLRPGGWLALLSTGERYDDPLGSAVVEMWAARSHDHGEWVKQRKLSGVDLGAAADLFDAPIERDHDERLTVPAQAVVDVENTRATSLSWDEDVRRGFNRELRHHLRSLSEVHLTQRTRLTMLRARVRA